jgi:hypothetical protein
MIRKCGYVYAVRNNYTNLTKIGLTTNPANRIRSLETGGGVELDIICVVETHIDPKLVETAIHEKLDLYRKLGEWFDVDEETALTAIKSIVKPVGIKHLFGKKPYLSKVKLVTDRKEIQKLRVYTSNKAIK